MATYPIRPPRIASPSYDNWRQGPASGTFNKGALVYWDTTNKVFTECSANPTLIAGIALMGSGDVLDGGGAGPQLVNYNVSVAPITSSTEIVMTLGGTYAASDIGASYGIAKDSTTGNWYVNKADTTNTRVRVLRLVNNPEEQYQVGDTNVRVIVQVLPSYVQTGY